MTSILDLVPIFALPVSQRIEVVHEILDSIAADSSRPSLSEEFKRELFRRRDEARANPADDFPWEAVEAEALARCRE